MTARSTLRVVLACLYSALFLASSVLATDDCTRDDTGGQCADVKYVPRPDAAEDLLTQPSNFLKCTSGEYALCYYSGADPLPCTIDESGTHADCECQVFTATKEKPMYVDIQSILDACAYQEANTQCESDGSCCLNITPTSIGKNPAYVCDYIADGTFDPAADYISTFSFEVVSAPNRGGNFGIGCHDRVGQYAGCMTASCTGLRTDVEGNRYTTCSCPLWPLDGTDQPYQFGRACDADSTKQIATEAGNCALGPNQVWSAAYNPEGCS